MRNRERLNIAWEIKRTVELGKSNSPLLVSAARKQFEDFCNRELEISKEGKINDEHN